jgi:hypothetical protein
MAHIIKEFSLFETKSSEQEEYPYTFDFIGEEGKYQLQVQADDDSFRVVFPDGKIVNGTSEMVRPGSNSSEFNQEDGVLKYFIQQQFFQQTIPHVSFERRFNYSKEHAFLSIMPSWRLCSLSLPEGKCVFFRSSLAGSLGEFIDVLDKEVKEWIGAKIYDTNFFYQSFFGGKDLYESNGDQCQELRGKGIVASKIEMDEDEYYEIVCDKDRDIIVVHYPARCIPTTSDRFFEDVDGLIGTHKGKIESFFLDKLREAKFDMKAVLNSRYKAMEIIDAWRQKKS